MKPRERAAHDLANEILEEMRGCVTLDQVKTVSENRAGEFRFLQGAAPERAEHIVNLAMLYRRIMK